MIPSSENAIFPNKIYYRMPSISIAYLKLSQTKLTVNQILIFLVPDHFLFKLASKWSVSCAYQKKNCMPGIQTQDLQRPSKCDRDGS